MVPFRTREHRQGVLAAAGILMATYDFGIIGPNIPPPNQITEDDEFYVNEVAVDHFRGEEALIVITTSAICPDCLNQEPMLTQCYDMDEAEALYIALEGALAAAEVLNNEVHDPIRQARIIQLLENGTQRRVMGVDADRSETIELTGLVAADIVADQAA